MTDMVIGLHMQGRGGGGPLAEVQYCDLYQLCTINLSAASGLMIAAGCDQKYLVSHSDLLTDWVSGGGRLLTNGHPMLSFVSGLPQVRRLDYRGTDDIWLYEEQSHPIWEGVDRRDVLLRTGVPGVHSFEQLRKIGVAGFYARAYLGKLPENATVITSIGPNRLPVDISYPVGAGEVIVHCGNDLTSFDNPAAAVPALSQRVIDYLKGVL